MLNSVKHIKKLFLATFILAISNQASATLVGDEIRVNIDFTLTNSAMLWTEFFTTVTDDDTDTNTGNGFTFDASAESILITPNASLFNNNSDFAADGSTAEVEFGFFEFTDLDWTNGPGEITGVTVTSNFGFDPYLVSFSEDEVYVTITGTTFDFTQDQFIQIDIQAEHLDDPIPAVPVPAAFWLFGSAIGLFSLFRRQNR